MVLTKNTLVTNGISGIPKLLTHDLLYGTPNAENSLTQARYRPFSLVIFAIEYQLFGANPFVSHLINILLFTILIILLFKLLQNLFQEYNSYLAFVACLLFVVHPIHTEVIANVKSRDEIITVILQLISLFYFIRYSEKRSVPSLIIGLCSYFLALLTRESAVTFIAIIPLVLYFFFNQSIKKALLQSLPLIAVFIGYILLRIYIVGFSNPTTNSILDSPFLFASSSQAFATKVYILLKDICLLFFPHPLYFDYGFNQIPYVNILSFQFLISVLVLTSLISYAIYTFRRKAIVSFSIFYFLITISLASNILVDIGTPLSERLLFQPSLAFCIVIALFYLKTVKHFKIVVNAIFLIILVLFSIKTISRNTQWKNNQTLFFADVISAPDSFRTNLYAAINYALKADKETDKELKKHDFQKAAFYGEKSLSIYHNYPDTYLVLGDAYFGLHAYYKAADNWILADKFDSSNPPALKRANMLSAFLFEEGINFYRKHNINEAIKCFQKSTELNNKNVESWYYLGGIYFAMDDTKNGIEAWQNVINLSPNHPINKDQFHN